MRFNDPKAANIVPFGLERERIATALEILAEQIRLEKCHPQSVSNTVSNRSDDFELTTLSITYAGPIAT